MKSILIIGTLLLATLAYLAAAEEETNPNTHMEFRPGGVELVHVEDLLSLPLEGEHARFARSPLPYCAAATERKCRISCKRRKRGPGHCERGKCVCG